jgi:SAM-dependent methyltransferase
MHYGSRFHCPYCKSNLRKLYEFGFDFAVLREKQVIGGGRRGDCLCPVCESTDRERLLLLYLENNTTLFERPTKLLHVAPEPQLRKVIERHPNIEYVTGDLNRPDVTTRIDITNIRFPDDTFDAVICNHVLEHVHDDRRAMTELKRVLKPGGWAVLQVPISYVLTSTYEDRSISTEAERERAFGQFDHVRIYAADYLDRLAEAGFAVEPFDWTANSQAFGGLANRFALLKEEKIFAVRKPSGRDAGQALRVAGSGARDAAKHLA